MEDDSWLSGTSELLLEQKQIGSIDFIANFDELKTVKVLDLSSNIITIDSSNGYKQLAMARQLEKVNLSNNKISELPGDLFGEPGQRLTKLTNVDISHNMIEKLDDPDLFSELNQLEYVIFSSNRITRLNMNLFNGLTALKGIYFSDNTIGDLCSNRFKFPNSLREVEDIPFCYNSIQNLHKKLFAGLTNLNTISFSNNDIKTLEPGIFSGLLNLENLNFSKNMIEELDENLLQGLENLKLVDFSSNCIKKLHPNIFCNIGVTNRLQSILMHTNQIDDLDIHVFSGLHMLEVLNISNNCISVLNPGVFSHLSSLKRVCMRRNKITTLHPDIFDKKASLEQLDIRVNPAIKSLSVRVLQDLVNLKELLLDPKLEIKLSDRKVSSIDQFLSACHFQWEDALNCIYGLVDEQYTDDSMTQHREETAKQAYKLLADFFDYYTRNLTNLQFGFVLKKSIGEYIVKKRVLFTSFQTLLRNITDLTERLIEIAMHRSNKLVLQASFFQLFMLYELGSELGGNDSKKDQFFMERAPSSFTNDSLKKNITAFYLTCKRNLSDAAFESFTNFTNNLIDLIKKSSSEDSERTKITEHLNCLNNLDQFVYLLDNYADELEFVQFVFETTLALEKEYSNEYPNNFVRLLGLASSLPLSSSSSSAASTEQEQATTQMQTRTAINVIILNERYLPVLRYLYNKASKTVPLEKIKKYIEDTGLHIAATNADINSCLRVVSFLLENEHKLTALNADGQSVLDCLVQNVSQMNSYSYKTSIYYIIQLVERYVKRQNRNLSRHEKQPLRISSGSFNILCRREKDAKLVELLFKHNNYEMKRTSQFIDEFGKRFNQLNAWFGRRNETLLQRALPDIISDIKATCPYLPRFDQLVASFHKQTVDGLNQDFNANIRESIDQENEAIGVIVLEQARRIFANLFPREEHSKLGACQHFAISSENLGCFFDHEWYKAIEKVLDISAFKIAKKADHMIFCFVRLDEENTKAIATDTIIIAGSATLIPMKASQRTDISSNGALLQTPGQASWFSLRGLCHKSVGLLRQTFFCNTYEPVSTNWLGGRDTAVNYQHDYTLKRIGQSNQLRLINHETTQQLIELKWKYIPFSIYYASTLLHLIFLLTFSSFSVSYVDMAHNVAAVSPHYAASNQTASNAHILADSRWLHSLSHYTALALAVFFLVIELFQIVQEWGSYFNNMKNNLELFTYSCVILLLAYIGYFGVQSDPLYSRFASFLIIFGSIILLLRIEKYPKVGIFVIAFRCSFVKSFQLLPILVVLLCGFLIAFRVRSHDDLTVSDFDSLLSIPSTLTRLFAMMAGDYQTEKMGIGEKSDKANVTAGQRLEISSLDVYIFNPVIYALFIFLMSILFFNLFIGIAVGQLEQVLSEAEKLCRQKRIEYIYKIVKQLDMVSSDMIEKNLSKAFSKENLFKVTLVGVCFVFIPGAVFLLLAQFQKIEWMFCSFFLITSVCLVVLFCAVLFIVIFSKNILRRKCEKLKSWMERRAYYELKLSQDPVFSSSSFNISQKDGETNENLADVQKVIKNLKFELKNEIFDFLINQQDDLKNALLEK